MKKLILGLFLSSFLVTSFAAPTSSVNGGTNVSNINTAHLYFDSDISLSSSATSAFDINSSSKGARPYPLLNQSAINAIIFPEFGLEVYNLDLGIPQYFDGSSWQSIVASASPTVVNNVAQFAGVNGQLIDSGISAGSIVLTSGNQTIAGTKTFSSPIVGDLGGIAVNANNISTSSAGTNVAFYPIFVASSTNGYQQVRLDSGITLNPALDSITAATFNGALNGNANTVTNGVVTTGSYSDPSWITALSTAKLSGIVGMTNGGLGFSSATAGSLFAATGTNTPGKIAAVAAGQVLTSNGTTVVPVYSANPTISSLTLTANMELLMGNGGQILAKNSGGTYEGVMYPRFTDNRTYFDVGANGLTVRLNGGTTQIATDTSNNVSVPNGNLNVDGVGKTLGIKSGANSCTGTQILSGTSTVISTTCAKTGDIIDLSITSPGGTPGIYSYTISNGVSGTVTSTMGVADTSTLRYLFIHTN